MIGAARIDAAQQLGLTVTSTTDGTLTTTTIVVPDLPAFRQVLQVGTTPESRDALVSRMFDSIAPAATAAEDGTVRGTLQRVERYLLGNDELAPEDEGRAAASFPLNYTVITGAPNGPITGEYCLGTQQASLVTCDLDTMDLEDGGFITVYNTPVEFSVGTLTRNGQPAPGRYDFNVLGFTGVTGAVGGAVSAGAAGSTGGSGTCTVSGSEPGDNGGAGSTGTDGVAGNPGGTGGTGFPSLLANITISALTGAATTVSVFTQSGAGGPGGAGGTGAAGGTGGNGGDGATCECTGTSGGRGGNGGGGGTGGTGGTGGAAADKLANVTVSVPASLLHQIVTGTAMAPPGVGGTGGPPGPGGLYGSGGSGGKGHGSPGNGSRGTTGQTGATGPPGTVSGNPALIVVGSV